jgi:hypothetical protein
MLPSIPSANKDNIKKIADQFSWANRNSKIANSKPSIVTKFAVSLIFINALATTYEICNQAFTTLEIGAFPWS